ncbi:MAG: transporter [Bacteroidetes bacterium 43-16]|nr:MAG: transporter [Bacteroidetes bacterium 43-16]
MTIKKFIPVLLLAGTVALTSCKSNVPDAEVKSKVEAVVTPGVTVDVKDGVVTLNGSVNSDADKAAVEAAVKALDAKEGVKSVTNNITVAAPPPVTPAPEINTVDADLQAKVVDATKDFPTVQTSVKDGIITVTGEIEKAKVTKLKQSLDNLKPKKTDMSALKVK